MTRTSINAHSRHPKLSCFLLGILLTAASNFIHNNFACWAAEVVPGEDEGVATAVSALPSLSSEITACEKNSPRTKARPCPDPSLLRLSYVSRGAVDCGGALTPEQANMAPRVRVADSAIIDADGLYAMVLVDTTTTPIGFDSEFDSIRPILHYGAVNIPGSSLLMGLSLDRSDQFDVFFAYQGPVSPSLMVTDPRVIDPSEGDDRDIANDLLVYEFFLGAQPDGEDPLVVPEELVDSSPLRFDYEAFFDETVGIGFENITATTHFRSGSCVRDPVVTIGEKEEDDSSVGVADDNPPPSETTAAKMEPDPPDPVASGSDSKEPEELELLNGTTAVGSGARKTTTRNFVTMSVVLVATSSALVC